MRSRARATLSLLFFLSGATGLVYQLLWVRMLYQSFGSTIQSVTTVVAAYMGGLGLGAWLLGRRGDRHSSPAALYGWLEIAIGVFGILSPAILALVHWIYLALAGGLGVGGGVSIALRFGLAALVLLVPTTLMGGTLPVLTRAFMGDDRDALKPSLGRLYGLNTLGAVVGTALAGFFLLEFVGIRWSLWVTAAINIDLGILALIVARGLAPLAPVPPAPAAAPAGPRDALTTTALVLLGLTAFASLLAEIAWTRVLVMIVGGSTYAFTLILLVFLLGIGLGSAFVARGATSRDRAGTAASAAMAQGITAAGAALLFVFFTALPVYIIAVFQVQFFSALTRLLLMGVAVGGVVLIPALGMGMTFPLLTDLVARAGSARGADVGRAYALNTAGSILGAALTGFVLVTLLGSETTLRLGLVISAGAALALAYQASRGVSEGSDQHRRLQVRVLGAGGLAVISLVVAFAAPRWSTRLIDLGPTIYARAPLNASNLRAFLEHRGVRQMDYREGRNATASVWDAEGGRSLKVNGKSDASDHGDMDTQVMLGLAPVVARPHPTKALVVGHGSGVTASVLAAVPGMERVDVVELEPAVLAMDRYFTHINDSVLYKPNVHAIIDDARSALQLTRERFDIIVSEPSNPWVSGVATLYTPEFFRIVRSRLADDGVFSQWIQLYQLPVPIVAGIVRNLRSVFPYVEVWFGAPVDIVVLASSLPFPRDTAWQARVVGPGGSHYHLAREWLGVRHAADYDGRLLFADSGVSELVSRARLVHSDNRPSLEYAAARSFLSSEFSGVVLDSLILIGRRTGEGAAPERLTRSLAARKRSDRGLPQLEAMRREHPTDAEWTVRVAMARLAVGDTLFADTALRRVVAREPDRWPDAVLTLGQIAAMRRDTTRAWTLLTRSLAIGADTTQALAMLGWLAARSGRWEAAGDYIRAAIASARPSFRRPFPYAELGDAVARLASEGPPALADTVSEVVVTWRPGWSRAYALRAAAALRAGRCDVAADQFVALLDFGIRRPDGPSLVEECRRNER